MSDTPQQYILKRKDIRENLIRIFSAPLVTDDGQFERIFKKELDEAEALFVPLDVQALEKQLDRLLLENGAQFHEDYEALRAARPTKMSALEMKEKMEAESRKEFIEEVLALLFGLHNTEETDNG